MKTITLLILSLFLLLSLLGMGCGEGTNGPGGDDGDSEFTGQEPFTITATAPEGMVGDFYDASGFCGSPKKEDTATPDPHLRCENVNTCTFEIKRWEAELEGVDVCFSTQNRLFVLKSIEPKGEDLSEKVVGASVNWDQPGDWGMAPNGYYEYNTAGTTHHTEIRTKLFWIEAGESRVGLFGLWDTVPITGNTFRDETGEIEGTISDDLKTIEVRSWGTTYTLME